jgi:hypothetical protein
MTKKSYGRLALMAAVAFVALPSLAPAQVPWVLVARKAAQRIHHMQVEGQNANEPRMDFATVLLEAPADKVFATTLDLVRKNREVMLLMSDPAARRLQIAQGDRLATINVVEFGPEASQLMIAGRASPNEQPTASRVVEAVMRVCAEMKKECQVER